MNVALSLIKILSFLGQHQVQSYVMRMAKGPLQKLNAPTVLEIGH